MWDALAVVLETSYTPETLESIDLIVTADAEQLDAFYESASSDGDEEEESKRDSPPVTETASAAQVTDTMSAPVAQDEAVATATTDANLPEGADVAEESKESGDVGDDEVAV